ncbi:uncharacterized protein [Gossypium hirsutum]|uniref:Uncharacterized protein n=1 Tax=Gossypium hirsutum TaxID=3635 RepID=A0ABM3AN47_GOSHI|nr:uncharacterized protein LOC121220738 [Gossypium hirsutum]
MYKLSAVVKERGDMSVAHVEYDKQGFEVEPRRSTRLRKLSRKKQRAQPPSLSRAPSPTVGLPARGRRGLSASGGQDHRNVGFSTRFRSRLKARPSIPKDRRRRVFLAFSWSNSGDEKEPPTTGLTAIQVSDTNEEGLARMRRLAARSRGVRLGVAGEEATRGMRLLGFLLLISAENVNVVWARFLIFGPICDWVIICIF